MRIAVAGGSGTAGRYTMLAAEAAGHETISLSRSAGVDLLTGSGLERALEGVTVVVDAVNVRTTKRQRAADFFRTVARHLQEAGARAGVHRIVVLSVVGVDSVPYGYYQAKLAQEEASRQGPLPVSIVRATQFYEFAAQILARARLGPLALAPRMVVQPIAARAVGQVLVEVATAAGLVDRVEVAGPVAEYLPDMAQAIMQRQGKHVLVLPFSRRGEVGVAMRDGVLLPGEGVRVEGPNFVEWLEGTDPLGIGRRPLPSGHH